MGRIFQMGAKMTLKDAFTSTMSKIRKETEGFTKKVKLSSDGVKTFKDSQGKLRYANGQFVQGLRDAKRESDNLKRSIGGLNGAAGLLRKGFALLGIAAAFKAAKTWLVDSNAEMETYKNTLAIVLKSEEKAVKTLAWAQKFAAKTPFEIPQIVEATTRMSAYGINAQKTLGIVGDMASVMGKDLMQAVEAVADAQTGELERLKEFGITKNMLKEQAKRMKVDIVNKKGQITDQKAFNAVLFKLMEDRFKGGMDMQSKTLKGMVSNFKDFVSSTARELGAPIFDKVKEGLGNVLTWLQKLKDSGALSAFMGKVQSVGGFIYKYLAANILFSINRVKMLSGMIASWYTANKPLITKLGAAFIKAFNSLRTWAMPIITWLMNVGVPKLVTALGKVGTFVLKIANWFITNWGLIKPMVLGIAVAWGTYFVITKAISVATKTWAAIQWVLNAAMNANPIGLIITGIGLLIGVIILLVTHWKTVKVALMTGMKAVGDFFAKAVTGISNFFKKVFNGIVAFFKKWGVKILVAMTFPFTLFPYLVITNIDKIKAFLGVAVEWIKGAFKGVGSFIGNVFHGLIAVVKGPINFMIRGINVLVSALNGINIDIPDWVPGVGGKKFGFKIPEVPYLAKGTNNFAGGPAVINERGGEMAVMPSGSKVIPADKTDKILEGGKGRTTIIQKVVDTLNIYQQPGEDPKALAKRVISELLNEIKSAEEIIGSDDMGVLV